MTQNFASDGDRTRDRLSPDVPTQSRRRPSRLATEDTRFKPVFGLLCVNYFSTYSTAYIFIEI